MVLSDQEKETWMMAVRFCYQRKDAAQLKGNILKKSQLRRKNASMIEKD